MCAAVAVLGHHDQVLLLLKEMLDFESKCNQLPISDITVSLPMTYIVKTKYFTAPIVLSHHDLRNDGDYPCDFEGVIIYMAAKDSALLKNLKMPADPQQCKLLVIDSSAEDADSDNASRIDLINWALDNGCEYIDLPAGLNESTKNWSVREKEGFPRMIEAIHSTIWSSANKTGGTAQPGNPVNIEKLESGAARDSSSSADVAAIASAASVTEEPKTLGKKKKAGKKSVAEKEDAEMQQLESLETIFQKVKEQRAALERSSAACNDSDVSSGTALSQADIDRRASAAKMAMELCSLMNLCDSDSDYESDSDD